MTSIEQRASELLADLAGPSAVLRGDQLQAIEAAVGDGRRVLVVQRTGFGKSAVYFIATRILRERGAGPTLVVSPLLALMRDQVAAAARTGVRSATINSTNPDDWAEIERQLAADELDLLLVSPERLNHHRFARQVLPRLASGLGLLVVDEAHCISDWGHDFRPDYRRIRDAIANLDPSTPVIATTATANERVTLDVVEQLGGDALVLRGTLDRESLHLGVVRLESLAERLAWLADRISRVEGTGIVYCLTVDGCEQAATFLRSRGIDAVAYTGRTPPEERTAIEARFIANDVKVLVATSALGMGVDKADVTFVLHLGAPPSPIAYYQQVGRAGRAVDRAEAWLLPAAEDQAIWSWFAAVGLPPESVVRRVLDQLGPEPVTLARLEQVVDLTRTRLEALLKILDVDGAVERVDSGWIATGRPWAYDAERVARIRSARDAEAAEMLAYATESRCLMEVLRASLDDPGAEPCGRCTVCLGAAVDRGRPEPDAIRAAVELLRGADVPIEPRKQWPRSSGPGGGPWPSGNIAVAGRAEQGRALCRVGDAGWWPVVARCEASSEVDDELIAGVFAVLKRWPWAARPTWVTAVGGVPGSLAGAVAARVADAGHLELLDLVSGRAGDAVPASNSQFRLAEVWGRWSVPSELDERASGGPGLVVVDRCGSRWTTTVVAHLLRTAGSGPVLPLALAQV